MYDQERTKKLEKGGYELQGKLGRNRWGIIGNRIVLNCPDNNIHLLALGVQTRTMKGWQECTHLMTHAGLQVQH
jgi:hypothetical protein